MFCLARLFVLRGGHAGMRQVLAQVPHGAAVERVAVVRPVQDALGAVQLHSDSISRQWMLPLIGSWKIVLSNCSCL